MEIDRDAATVVDDRDGVVDVDGDIHLVTEPGERLVDRVVDDLVHEMVQPRRARRADVHGRTLANGFKPLENLDLVCAVVVGAGGAIAVRAHRSAGRGFTAVAVVVRLLLLFGILHAHPGCQILIGMIT